MSKFATCWKITREDTEVLGFTDHDNDIEYDGTTYAAAAGYKPSAIEHKCDGSSQNMEVVGIVHFSGINQDDLRSGLFDYAKVECFQIDWDTLTDVVPLMKGWLGGISISDGQFNAELRSLSHKLHNNIGDQYTPQCRVALGSTECGYELTPVAFTVTTGGSNRIFTDSGLTQATDYFKSGLVTFTSGDNDTFSMDVKEFSLGGIVELYEPVPNEIVSGDTGLITRGCAKTLEACNLIQGNVYNFRGFPHLPGITEIFSR